MAEAPITPEQDGTPVNVDDVLSGFQAEIARLTRRVVFAEVEARTLRAQAQQHMARIADLEQQAGSDSPPDTA